MAKVIALVTGDPAFFYEAVEALREGGHPFISLAPGEPLPPGVGAVVTTDAEREGIDFPLIVSDSDPSRAVSRAAGRLRGGSFERVVVGVDPGPRPGMVVLADGKLVMEEVLSAPEDLGPRLEEIRGTMRLREMVLRIGHGDPTNRDRAIISAWGEVDGVEVVDETSTTVSVTRPEVDAALRIALMGGERLPAPPEVSPTPGELREIQRLSRLESGGRVTISLRLADAVARGRMTLSQAVRAQRRG